MACTLSLGTFFGLSTTYPTGLAQLGSGHDTPITVDVCCSSPSPQGNEDSEQGHQERGKWWCVIQVNGKRPKYAEMLLRFLNVQIPKGGG